MATLKLDLARMRLIAGFVDTYLRLTPEEEAIFRRELAAMEPQQQEVIMEITTSWMEEGRQQGRQQGLQQGRQQGLEQGRQHEALLVLRQLTRRLGEIEPDVRARIETLSLTQLEELGEALLDFSTTADLDAWLDQRSA